MKAMRCLTLAAALGATACLSGQTITEFIVGKLNDRTQTDGSGSVAGATPYGFFAQVVGTGLSGTYEVVIPGGTAAGTVALPISGDEAFVEEAFAYADVTALNAVYGNGDYGMNINTSGGLVNITNFSLTGDSFPNNFSITSVVGGTWSNNRLVVDPSVGFTLNFDAFSGMTDGVDRIILGIDAGYDDESTSPATTSFTIGAGQLSLAPSATTSAELAFAKVIDTDMSIGGATGFTAYVTIVSFQIQAIPEPSTYAAMAGVLALAGVMLRRRMVAV